MRRVSLNAAQQQSENIILCVSRMAMILDLSAGG